MRTPGRPARLVPLVLVGLLGACSGTPEPVVDDVPVAVAEAVSFSDAGLTPPSTPARSRDAAAAPSRPAVPATEAPRIAEPPGTMPVGPTSADAAAFLQGDPGMGLTGLEHVLVDLDGDSWKEVVATGMHDRRGVVLVAWWTAAGYEVLARDEAGPGSGIADLRAADVNHDGTTEVMVGVEGDGLRSIALWAVPGRGRLVPLEAVGGCHDGTHVYGVTRAWLESRGDGPHAIVADCDESPLPVADWAEQRWLWEDGAYRHAAPPPPPDDGGDGGGGRPDDKPDKGPPEDGPPGTDPPGNGPPDGDPGEGNRPGEDD